MAISKIKGSAIQDATIPEEKLEDEAGSFRMILNASDGSATDAGDFLLLDATASSTNVGEQFLFEPATDDGSAVLSGGDLNLENFKLSEMDKNSTIKSENGAVTTNIVQGLAKSFEIHDDDETSLIESFNISSITDGAAGICAPVFTNNMTTANYFTAGSTGEESTSFGIVSSVRYNAAATTSTYVYRVDNSANQATDRNNSMTINFGDLA